MSPKSGWDSSRGASFDRSGGMITSACERRESTPFAVMIERPAPDAPDRVRPGHPPAGAQAASIQIRLSWKGAPPTGATGSAPVRALMPIPSSNARFGQMLSTITTPG